MAGPGLSDGLYETSTTTGTGAYALAGARAGYATLSSQLADGDTCFYAARDRTLGGWEVGLGTYAVAGNTLARTRVLGSSNAGAAVSWGAGTRELFLAQPWAAVRGPVFNARGYGAKGDGVADDYAAIQAALTDAGNAAGGRGGEVFLPAGYYKVTQGLVVPAKVSLKGAGQWATTLYYNQASGYAVTVGNTGTPTASPENQYGSLEDFSVEGASSTNTATAFRVLNCVAARLCRLAARVIGLGFLFDGGAADPDPAWTGDHNGYDLHTTNVTGGIEFRNYCTHTTLVGAEVSGKGGTAGSRVGTGFKMGDRSATCHFFGVNVEGFGTGYSLATSGGSGSEFVSCREENNDTPVLWGTSSQNYLFVGGNGVFADPDAGNFYNGATTKRGTLTLVQRDGYFPKIAARPAAAADHRWRWLRSQGAAGVADNLWVCYKDASDSYQWKDLLAAATGAGATELLGYKKYMPASPASLDSAVNNNAFQDVDAANLFVSFTAPASGGVLVRLTGLAARSDSTVTKVYWGLRDGSGYVAGTGGKVVDGTGTVLPASLAFTVTGLTPGASYSWKWAHRPRESGATAKAQLKVGGDPSSTVTDANGPAVMEVWAL